MKRFVEWDGLDVRVDGARLEALAKEMIRREPMIERLQLTFQNGLLRIEGSIRKFISVPFRIDVSEVIASGANVRVPLARISAGPIPVPTILVGLVRDRLPKDLVHYEEPATIVMSLERFLPSFVSIEIQKIWIIDGGLAVTLGRGGADLPAGDAAGIITGGTADGSARSEQ